MTTDKPMTVERLINVWREEGIRLNGGADKPYTNEEDSIRAFVLGCCSDDLERAHNEAIATLEAEVGRLKAIETASRRVAIDRHTHTAIGAGDGGETCGQCGENFRSAVHFRLGESFETDMAELRAALAQQGERS